MNEFLIFCFIAGLFVSLVCIIIVIAYKEIEGWSKDDDDFDDFCAP